MGYERRTVLGACVAALSGSASGCLRLTQEAESATENGETPPSTAEAAATDAASTTASAVERELGEDTYEWLSAGTAFDGIVDRTGSDTATVSVGDDNIERSLDPAILKVSPGTTVVWEWTGEGGGHNVVAMDGTFNYGATTLGDTTEFEHTFSEPGVYRYYCEPHESLGGRGVVVVDDDDE
jgi:halocyanin-like protein